MKGRFALRKLACHGIFHRHSPTAQKEVHVGSTNNAYDLIRAFPFSVSSKMTNAKREIKHYASPKRVIATLIFALLASMFIGLITVPYAHAATILGFDSVGGSGDNWGSRNSIWCKFTAAADGTATGVSFLTSHEIESDRNLKLAIYSNNASNLPGDLLGECPPVVVDWADYEWANGTLSSSVALTSGTAYWIGGCVDSGDFFYKFDVGDANQRAVFSMTYAALGDPFDGTNIASAAEKVSVYLTGTESGGSEITAQAGYTYTMVNNATATYILAENGTIMYNSTSANTAYETMLSYISTGGTYYVKTGTGNYTGDDEFYMLNINNTEGTWQNGAWFTIQDWLNTSVVMLKNAHNNTFTNLQINGNGFDPVTEAGLQTDTSSGWVIIDGDDNTLQNSTITNCHRDGVQVFETSEAETGLRNVVTWCNISYVGWNSITFGGSDPPPSVTCGYNNATYNRCWNNSDLGISAYGYNNYIAFNTVWGMNGERGSLSSHWGIALEDGGYNTATNNTVYDVVIGVNSDAETEGQGNYNTISFNNITNCGRGIGLNNNHSMCFGNNLTECGGPAGGNNYTIIMSGGVNNTICNNTIYSTTEDMRGMNLQQVSNCSIYNNTITQAITGGRYIAYGMKLETDVDTCEIYDNTFTSISGIEITDATSANNIIHDNAFSCNYTIDADDGTNTSFYNNTGLDDYYFLNVTASGGTPSPNGVGWQFIADSVKNVSFTGVLVNWDIETPDLGNFTDDPLTLTMNQSYVVVGYGTGATTYSITVADDGHGSVNATSPYELADGTSFSLQATADAGYDFLNWVIEDIGNFTGENLPLIMNATIDGKTITAYFTAEEPEPTPTPAPTYDGSLPTLNNGFLWAFLYSGDFLGFFQALFVGAFTYVDLLYGLLAMLFLVPLYLRTKSLLLLSILWILLGSFYIALMPVVSGVAVLFVSLGTGGLFYRIFRGGNQ